MSSLTKQEWLEFAIIGAWIFAASCAGAALGVVCVLRGVLDAVS